MTVRMYAELAAHAGHAIEVVRYGEGDGGAAVECTDCSEVLFEFEAPPDNRYRLSPRRVEILVAESHGSDSGEWWTTTLEVPGDTPEEDVENAAMAKFEEEIAPGVRGTVVLAHVIWNDVLGDEEGSEVAEAVAQDGPAAGAHAIDTALLDEQAAWLDNCVQEEGAQPAQGLRKLVSGMAAITDSVSALAAVSRADLDYWATWLGERAGGSAQAEGLWNMLQAELERRT
jgi:hypothetical protein